MTCSTDGTPTPISGSPLRDAVTCAFQDTQTLVTTGLKAGKPVDKQVFRPSTDGKEMVGTADTVDKDGKPYHFTTVTKKPS
jgi:hypothetical protein